MEELAIQDPEAPHSSRREAARLQALRQYPLNSWSDPELNRIVNTVSEVCEVPIALISIVDNDRQWFKVNIGLPFDETPRAESFCAHALDQRGLLLVPDTKLDERFDEHFLVTGPMGVRFYAGAPLRTPDNLTLGTLCIMDVVPRKLTDAQEWMLTSMAEQVMQRFERRRRWFDFNLTPEGLLPPRLHELTLVKLRSFVCTNPYRGALWIRWLSFLAGPILSQDFAAAFVFGKILGPEARPTSSDLTLQLRDSATPEKSAAALMKIGPARVLDMHGVRLQLCGPRLPTHGKPAGFLDRAPFWEQAGGPSTGVVRIDLTQPGIIQDFQDALTPLGGN